MNKLTKKQADNLFLVFSMVLALALGILGTLGYQEYQNKRQVNGLYLHYQ